MAKKSVEEFVGPVKTCAETGRLYGDWKVLGIGEKRSLLGGEYWLCQCSCGTTGEFRPEDLHRGIFRDCGCSRFKKSKTRKPRKPRKLQTWSTKLIDLKGKTFGYWFVEERDSVNTGDGRPLWVCRCKCGTVRSVSGRALREGNSKSCGCYSLEVSNGLSSPSKNRKRYKTIRRAGHPNARADGKILEHVYVMSEHLGRPIRPEETIHHRNCIRDDNRVENLELWSKNHPPGGRVIDKLAWAIEILQEYSPDYGFDKESAEALDRMQGCLDRPQARLDLVA